MSFGATYALEIFEKMEEVLHERIHPVVLDVFDRYTAGSGAFVQKPEWLLLTTGTTPNSWARVERGYDLFDKLGMSFSKEIRAFGCFYLGGNINDQVTWFGVGWMGYGSWTEKHLGFRIEEDTVYGTVADGTTESTVNLRAIAPNTKYVFKLVFKPGVECRFFIDGVDKGAIITNLPSGVPYGYILTAGVANPDVAANKQLNIRIWDFLQKL